MNAATLRLLSEGLDEVREAFAGALDSADVERLVEAGEVLDGLEQIVGEAQAADGAR